MRPIVTAILSVIVLVGSIGSVRQPHEALDTIQGRVVDSMTLSPVSGAQITVPLSSIITTSNSEGHYTLVLSNMSPVVRVYHEQYGSRTYRYGNLNRKTSDTFPSTFYLSPTPDTLLDWPATFLENVGCSCAVVTYPEPPRIANACTSIDFRGSRPLVPTTLYGREMWERPPWGRSDVIHVVNDSTNGLPVQLDGGMIHVSEICPGADTLTEANAADIAYTFIRDNAQFLGVNPGDLVIGNVRESQMLSRNGREAFVHFNQVRNSVPVFASSISLIFKLNYLYSYQARYLVTDISTTPSLTADEAFSRAKREQEAHLDTIGYPGTKLRCGSAKLKVDWLPGTRMTEARPPRLVWEINPCRTYEPGSSLVIVADAHTGELIRSYRDGIVCGPVARTQYRLEVERALTK